MVDDEPTGRNPSEQRFQELLENTVLVRFNNRSAQEKMVNHPLQHSHIRLLIEDAVNGSM